jgi:hypothetical protein
MVRPASSPRDLWHEAQVTVSVQQPADLVFEATVGETDRGDIALGKTTYWGKILNFFCQIGVLSLCLDSVSFVEGRPCVIRPNEAARFRAVSCSFNEDLCGYLSQDINIVSFLTFIILFQD